MSVELVIREATLTDAEAICAILTASGLSTHAVLAAAHTIGWPSAQMARSLLLLA